MAAVVELANFLSRIETVPAAAHRMALKAVLDLVASAVAGATTAPATSARRAASSIWGLPSADVAPSTIWFCPRTSTVSGAAYLNAVSASALDVDDGHRAASGHPGAAVIPAAIATAESCGAEADRLLSAIVIGYDVGVRIAAARDYASLRTTDSGLWSAYAAAAAAAWLRCLPPAEFANALAIAGTLGPGLPAAGRTPTTHTIKEGIPWATAAGLAAVDLAAAGQVGPIDIIDVDEAYDATQVTSSLGSAWAIEGTYFKLYSCCRWAHAAIDAALELKSNRKQPDASIREITVSTFPRALVLENSTRPTTLEAAQYSVPFCVAVALVRGADALLPLTEALLRDEAVLAMASKVRLLVDPEFRDSFPRIAPARVTIADDQGTTTAAVVSPAGEPANPLSLSEMERKFDVLAIPRIGEIAAARLKRAILDLGSGGDFRELAQALSAPLSNNTTKLRSTVSGLEVAPV